MNKTCILIFGIGHTGTTIISGTLKNMEIDGGLLIQTNPNKIHKKGIHENFKILKFNERVMKYIDENVSFPQPPVNFNKLNELKIFENELKNIIKSEYKEKIFFIKDPRLTYLNKLYIKVLNDLGVNVKIILTKRNLNNLFLSCKGKHYSKDINMFNNYIETMNKHIDIVKKTYNYIEVDFNEILNNKDKEFMKIIKYLNLNINKNIFNSSLNFIDEKIPRNS